MKKLNIDKFVFFINKEKPNKIFLDAFFKKELIFKNLDNTFKLKNKINKITDLINLIEKDGIELNLKSKTEEDIEKIQKKLKIISESISFRGGKINLQFTKEKIKILKINVLSLKVSEILKKLEKSEGFSILNCSFTITGPVEIKKNNFLREFIVKTKSDNTGSKIIFNMKVPIFKSFEIMRFLEEEYKVSIDNYISE